MLADSSHRLRNAIQHSLVTGLALVAAAWLVARLADVLMMAFASVLAAVLLSAVASPLQTRLGLGRPFALAVAAVLIAVVFCVVIWAFGHQAEGQFTVLTDVLPSAWAQAQARLGSSQLGSAVLARLAQLRGFEWLVSLGPRLAANIAGALAGTVIVLFAGLYLAFHPESYLRGVLLLLPTRRRERASYVFGELYHALRQWLVGQLLSMVLVGVTTGVGLAWAGVPSPFALGIIAGLGQFIPVIGPMAATVPGLLVALEVGPQTLIWASLVYLLASQLEANVITPLVLRQLAQLPMAVTLFAVLAMGVLLGPLGVLFATPLAVVAYVLVRTIYVEGVLGEDLKAVR